MTFITPDQGGGGGGGTITEIESTDGFLTVTNPMGPTVDLTQGSTPVGPELTKINVTFADSPYTPPNSSVGLMVDTSAGNVIIDTPAAPINGQIVEVYQIAGGNQITLSGWTVADLTPVDLVLGVQGAVTQLQWDNLNATWRMVGGGLLSSVQSIGNFLPVDGGAAGAAKFEVVQTGAYQKVAIVNDGASQVSSASTIIQSVQLQENLHSSAPTGAQFDATVTASARGDATSNTYTSVVQVDDDANVRNASLSDDLENDTAALNSLRGASVSDADGSHGATVGVEADRTASAHIAGDTLVSPVDSRWRGASLGTPTPLAGGALHPADVFPDPTVSATGLWIVDQANTPVFLAAGAGLSTLLAVVTITDSPFVIPAYTTGMTLVTMGATLATVAFTVTATGNVVVKVFINLQSGPDNAQIQMGLYDHTTGAQYGFDSGADYAVGGSSGSDIREVCFPLTGLPAGPIQMDLAAYDGGPGPTYTSSLVAGAPTTVLGGGTLSPNPGPMVITVEAAP